MQIRRIGTALALIAALAACKVQEPKNDELPNPDTAEEAPDTNAENDGETVSILRADIEQPELPPAPLEPLNAVIGFPAGGADIDDVAAAAIMDVTSSEQLLLQGPIVLRGHSDAGGSDDANMRASLARAENVRDYMVDLGVDQDRFTIIAFGEQNPIEPNALPDGTPNEDGRALNRRVEVLIVPPAGERIEDDTSTGAGD